MQTTSDKKMPWGKFKGKEIWRLPSPYLKWVAENFDKKDICEAADAEWQWREKYDQHVYEVMGDK